MVDTPEIKIHKPDNDDQHQHAGRAGGIDEALQEDIEDGLIKKDLKTSQAVRLISNAVKVYSAGKRLMNDSTGLELQLVSEEPAAIESNDSSIGSVLFQLEGAHIESLSRSQSVESAQAQYLQDQVHELLFGAEGEEGPAFSLARPEELFEGRFLSASAIINGEHPDVISERLATGVLFLSKGDGASGSNSLVAGFVPASLYDEIAPMVSDEVLEKLVPVDGIVSLYDAVKSPAARDQIAYDRHWDTYDPVGTPDWETTLVGFLKDNPEVIGSGVVLTLEPCSCKAMSDVLPAPFVRSA